MTEARLRRLVDHYFEHFAAGRARDEKRFAGLPDLKTAIRDAALARREDGRCESHQRRVGLVVLRRFERGLQRSRARLGAARTFDELHALVAARKVARVGALTVYDTALRIGGYLGLRPGRVYLHAGTRVGARALGIKADGDVVKKSDLPIGLRRMRADDIENFLCIYKGAFRGGRWPVVKGGCRGGGGGCGRGGEGRCPPDG